MCSLTGRPLNLVVGEAWEQLGSKVRPASAVLYRAVFQDTTFSPTLGFCDSQVAKDIEQTCLFFLNPGCTKVTNVSKFAKRWRRKGKVSVANMRLHFLRHFWLIIPSYVTPRSSLRLKYTFQCFAYVFQFCWPLCLMDSNKFILEDCIVFKLLSYLVELFFLLILVMCIPFYPHRFDNIDTTEQFHSQIISHEFFKNMIFFVSGLVCFALTLVFVHTLMSFVSER